MVVAMADMMMRNRLQVNIALGNLYRRFGALPYAISCFQVCVCFQEVSPFSCGTFFDTLKMRAAFVVSIQFLTGCCLRKLWHHHPLQSKPLNLLHR
jgi:hypothetical protein